MKIATILDLIDLGQLTLPEFQRGYVWSREQVRALMDSLYRKYPVGSVLVWVTQRDSGADSSINLILDGQQRLTTLYGIIHGRPPKFFDGDPRVFTGLYFHLEEESFEFYSAAKMQGNPLWIDVTKLMQFGVSKMVQQLLQVPELAADLEKYLERLNAIDQIKNIELPVHQVTGQDKTINVVVDIFNRLNSGGTKLSSGDLALAKVCARLPEARQELKARLRKWAQAGFSFKLDWLLRNITAAATGQASFQALERVSTAEFQQWLVQTERMVDTLLNMVSSRLGLDHDRVLAGRYALPVLCRYLVKHGGKIQDHRERDRLLYWYVHSFLWGRFSGSTETVLDQDLRVLDEHDGVVDRLIDQLRRSRGDLVVRPEDFRVSTLGARFYPMLYLLTRVYGARDWCTGLPLSAHLLGKSSTLNAHHIFPKKVLYSAGYSLAEVNSVANYCFQTQDCNLGIGARLPEEYFEEVEAKHPGALASQWVPVDRALWSVTRFPDFLEARQVLLAKAANSFLDQLLRGTLPQPQAIPDITTRTAPPEMAAVMPDGEDDILECVDWVSDRGLPEPEVLYELVDDAGQVLAVLHLAWPDGLQPGLSQPVAVVPDPTPQVQRALNRAGYRFFPSTEEFKRYALTEVLGEKAAQ